MILDFFKTIEFIDDKEIIEQELIAVGIHTPTVMDVCRIIGVSYLEFLYNLETVTIPKEYTDIIKTELSDIVGRWNYYSDYEVRDDYMRINNDYTKIYREYQLRPNDNIKYETITFKYESE